MDDAAAPDSEALEGFLSTARPIVLLLEGGRLEDARARLPGLQEKFLGIGWESAHYAECLVLRSEIEEYVERLPSSVEMRQVTEDFQEPLSLLPSDEARSRVMVTVPEQ